MYSLLIVDDELDNLYWLQEMFQYDFEPKVEVSIANSGRKALELLNQTSFDVVLTDIKMPGMDGIRLFEKIKENWPACKVVFLTAYGNFLDIYRIIQNKDVKYILKSEEKSKIKDAVRESLEEIEEMLRTSHWEKNMERAKYILEREAFQNLLEDIDKKQKVEDSIQADIRIDLRRKMLCTLIRMDHPTGSAESGVGERKVELDHLMEIIEGYLPVLVTRTFYRIDRKSMMLFTQLAEEDWKRLFTLTQGALEYAEKALELHGQTFSALISSTAEEVQALPGKLLWMRRIFAGKMYEETGVIAHAEVLETEQEKNEKTVNPALLKTYLELKQREDYFAQLESLLEKLNSYTSIHDMEALELYYQITITFLQYINENRLNERLAFKIGLYKLVNFNEHASWQEAGNYLFDLSEAIFELIGERGEGKGPTDLSMEKLEDYIAHHLSEDLSLTRLAALSGFNASYLSRIFKKKYGIGLFDYIVKKRMELAKTMLLCTDEKIQNIAVKTGYLSAHSFSRAFRSSMGLSPVEYREKGKEMDGK